MSRTNWAAAPTMLRTLHEAFADHVAQAELLVSGEVDDGDPDAWQDGQSRYEDEVWGPE